MSYKVNERIFKLKQGVEAVTGENYNDLTEAVQGLKDGYGQGGESGGGDIVPLLEGTIEEITIPNEVTKLRNGTFIGFEQLKEINADESHEVYSSADGILYTKDGKKLVSYPPAKEETEYIMPDSVEEIESYAFNESKNLERVMVNENLSVVPTNKGGNVELAHILNADVLAQGGVYPLKSEVIDTVIIPEGSTYISATAFDTLPNIKTMYFNSECEFETIGVSDEKGGTRYFNALHYVEPKKLVFGGDVKNISKYYVYATETILIGDSVETIAPNALAGAYNMRNLKIGNGVKTIGANAFGKLADSTDEGIDLIIPDSVTEISEDAFKNSHFKKFRLSNNLTEIKVGTFYACEFAAGYGHIEIPSSVTTIGDYAFAYCQSLFSVFIPNSVTSISNTAFESARCIIKGYAGSYAETYATENGYNFEVIEE